MGMLMQFPTVFAHLLLGRRIVFQIPGRIFCKDGNGRQKMRRNGFEGWYYKQRCGDYMLAFIPGQTAEGAFVQMIDSAGARRFSMPDFSVRGDTVHTGSCVFSPQGIRIRLPGVEGELRYGETTPLRSDIMGPFAHLPMQCRHGVVSMQHSVDGEIRVGGKLHRFADGSGYAEKDSGRSFPGSYLWVQCNEFDRPCAFMLSVAHIPFLGGSFTGCICALIFEGKEYRFATYRGVRLQTPDETTVLLRQGKRLLEVSARPLGQGHLLLAPQDGRMSETIRESCDAHLHLRLTEAGRTLLECQSDRAVYEKR